MAVDPGELKLEDLLRKLGALQRLADNAGTQAEAEAAAAKIQELMFAYGIERAQVDIASGLRPTGYGHQYIHVGESRWKQSLAWGVARNTHCKGVRTRTPEGLVVLDVIGQKDNVKLVIDTYHWLTRVVDHLLKTAPYRRQGTGSRQWATDFRVGAVARLIDRMAASRHEAEMAARASNAQVGTTLTVIDDKLREVTRTLYPSLRTARTRGRTYVTSGYMAGYEAGAQPELRKPASIDAPRKRVR
jgi:hypothetical protein